MQEMFKPIYIDANVVKTATPMGALIDALEDAFKNPPTAPQRHHHEIKSKNGCDDATLLLMPAFRAGDRIGIKIVTVFPNAGDYGLAAVQGVYLVHNGKTGRLEAIIDGNELTRRRTAAASALAARFLSRSDAGTLLIVGAGAMAGPLIEAHCSVRNYHSVFVWARNFEKSRIFARYFDEKGISVTPVEELEGAVREADVISCATLSQDPLVLGRWLKPGVHLDLVGSFTPKMRETDSEAVRMARIFVDTRMGALAEAGDLLMAAASGCFSASGIVAEMSDLCLGTVDGRISEEEITLFKSVGASLEDFAAAGLVLEFIKQQNAQAQS